MAFNIDTSDSRQIDDGKIGRIIGVDSEFDGIIDDLSSFTCDLISKFFDVGSDLCEIGVFLASSIIFEYSIRLAI